MAVERTLSIIKPDAVAKNVIGKIYTRFEDAGLKIIAARMAQLSRQDQSNVGFSEARPTLSGSHASEKHDPVTVTRGVVRRRGLARSCRRPRP